jgi:hypothetical protein
MLITDTGVLVRTRVAEIRELGRATQGVTLIALDEGAKLIGLQRIVENDANSDAEGDPKPPSGSRRRRHTPEAPSADKPHTPLRKLWGVFSPIAFLIAESADYRAAHVLIVNHDRPYNFSAGPAAIPEEVLQQAAAEMLDWHGSGMGVMEMSHRGKEFISIYEAAEADLRELLAVPANFKILFMQGGGLAENAIVPLNLSRGGAVDFVVTGSWSQKSAKEAGKYASNRLAASGEASNFTSCPRRQLEAEQRRSYVHICSNETIHGVEFQSCPT